MKFSRKYRWNFDSKDPDPGGQLITAPDMEHCWKDTKMLLAKVFKEISNVLLWTLT